VTKLPRWFLGLLMARAAVRTTPVRSLTPEPSLSAVLSLDEAHRAVQRQWPTSPPWMTAWDEYDRKRAVRFIEPRKSPTGEGKAA
jgi:hypothetical protein